MSFRQNDSLLRHFDYNVAIYYDKMIQHYDLMIVSLRRYDIGAVYVEKSVESVEKTCWKC